MGFLAAVGGAPGVLLPRAALLVQLSSRPAFSLWCVVSMQTLRSSVLAQVVLDWAPRTATHRRSGSCAVISLTMSVPRFTRSLISRAGPGKSALWEQQ
jgi:hypothetical protein